MAATTREEKIRACQVTEAGSGWDVQSPSGKTYRVLSITRLDELGSLYFVRRCSCPARGDCVHLAAVDRYMGGFTDAPEVAERID